MNRRHGLRLIVGVFGGWPSIPIRMPYAGTMPWARSRGKLAKIRVNASTLALFQTCAKKRRMISLFSSLFIQMRHGLGSVPGHLEVRGPFEDMLDTVDNLWLPLTHSGSS